MPVRDREGDPAGSDDLPGPVPLNEDEDEEEDNPRSLYNDGKGIQISATLVGTLPSLKAGEKRRANAKPPMTTKIVYIHEDTEFTHGLSEIIGCALGRRDLCRGGADEEGHLLPKTMKLFSLAFTIPRSTSFKDVEMLTEQDWETFLSEAAKKATAHGKLVITEKGVPDVAPAEEDDSDEDNERAPRKKKKLKQIPTDEEVAQDAIIKLLTEKHMCEDRKCSFQGPCWVDAEKTAHIHLTHLHLRTWAAAIESGADGVDDEHPPNAKIFDAGASNSRADIATMAKRRAAAVGASSGSNVYVSFDGLAELLRGPPTLDRESASILAKAPIDVTKWPKMDLAEFCERYDLPAPLQEKLLVLGVQGPHVLCWLKDDDLRGEGRLLLGELGTLRDAEQRWKNTCTWD